MMIHNPEYDVREELRNICRNAPVFPGKTIAHRTANECVRRGWAERNQNGDFVPTGAGSEVDEMPMPPMKLLPDWVKALLHELYHPLGKRRMQEAFRPFARAMLDVAER